MGVLNIILIILSSYVMTNLESEDKVRYFLVIGVIAAIIIVPKLFKLIISAL